MISRHVFHVDTDTGTWVGVSAPFMGSLRQVRWNPEGADTGGSLEMTMLLNETDTGDGWTFLQKAGLGTAFVDTGVNVIGAGEKFKVSVRPGAASLSGKLYVWVGE
ncbi:hypothetical protein [Aquamicrobium sp.]|uniref:hypothetical protein n=1 Tax=Aquamicrobium sp. TaxID=1872579 RepID=UPI00258CCD84|nr:hypothetical protein [Aquamicrobium sp.]MCK9549210.1 hypothetical protein [Aquamicrobium sp.]